MSGLKYELQIMDTLYLLRCYKVRNEAKIRNPSADPEGGAGGPDPLENHKYMGFYRE